MKHRYMEQARALCHALDPAETLLADIRVVDNTLASARDRVARFTKYKTECKGACFSPYTFANESIRHVNACVADFVFELSSLLGTIFSAHLEIDALFNTLTTRLADHKRAPFVPTEEHLAYATLSTRVAAIKSIETCESGMCVV